MVNYHFWVQVEYEKVLLLVNLTYCPCIIKLWYSRTQIRSVLKKTLVSTALFRHRTCIQLWSTAECVLSIHFYHIHFYYQHLQYGQYICPIETLPLSSSASSYRRLQWIYCNNVTADHILPSNHLIFEDIHCRHHHRRCLQPTKPKIKLNSRWITILQSAACSRSSAHHRQPAAPSPW